MKAFECSREKSSADDLYVPRSQCAIKLIAPETALYLLFSGGSYVSLSLEMGPNSLCYTYGERKGGKSYNVFTPSLPFNCSPGDLPSLSLSLSLSLQEISSNKKHCSYTPEVLRSPRFYVGQCSFCLCHIFSRRVCGKWPRFVISLIQCALKPERES